MITVSIVSHGQGQIAAPLLEHLLKSVQVSQILLTRNISEDGILPNDPRLTLIENKSPKGFAANHNTAFTRCNQPYFCVMNPDIVLSNNPFGILLDALHTYHATLVAPLIVDEQGNGEDSIRQFPTLRSLLYKLIGHDISRYHVVLGQQPFSPEWLAGMFLLFRSEDFARLGGFDEKFFLYYEDVDICARAWKMGMKIIACPTVSARHDARRQSQHDVRYLRWHLFSLCRYFRKYWCRLPKIPHIDVH